MEIADKAGVRHSTISKWERDQRGEEHPFDALARVVGALGADGHEILTGSSFHRGQSQDPAPARTEAAELARKAGVWGEAIRSVCADPVDDASANRSVDSWLQAMKLRESEMIDEALRRRAGPPSAVPPGSHTRPAKRIGDTQPPPMIQPKKG